MPSQNDGIDVRNSITVWTARSSTFPRLTADTTPSSNPATSATPEASSVSIIVAGTCAQSRPKTGSRVAKEVPRSPCANPPRWARYWSHNDRSVPSCVRILAIVSAVALSPAISAAGSPGSQCSTRKTRVIVPAVTKAAPPTRLRINRTKSGTQPGDMELGEAVRIDGQVVHRIRRRDGVEQDVDREGIRLLNQFALHTAIQFGA